MKKILSLLFFFALIGAASAQYTTPRTGTGVNYDARKISYSYLNKTDAAGADSVALTPNAYVTTYRLVLVDSFTLKQPTVTKSYAGDKLEIVCSAASGTPKLKFTGSNWVTAGTATLSSGLRAVITLIFDGSKWVEAYRTVQ